MKISSILLAAGSSRRMGQNKLMLELGGKPLFLKTLEELELVNFVENVVVLGNERERLLPFLKEKNLTITYNEDFHLGMHTSIKSGLKSLQKDCDAFFICQADQPYFSHKILNKLVQVATKSEKKIVAPFFQQRQGNPVLLSSSFISEILDHEDGDFGCSYLLKKYPHEIEKVVFGNSDVLTDMDLPEDYQKIQSEINRSIDPISGVMNKILQLRQENIPFAVATVIEVMGSSSARVGSKAIFSQMGENLMGWIGGGCAERFVSENCQEAIREKQSRIITADLEDEVFGLGIDCGGKMKIFIEPHLPMQKINIESAPEFISSLQTLAGFYGLHLEFSKVNTFMTFEETLIGFAKEISLTRSKEFRSLREVKNVSAFFQEKKLKLSNQVFIIGKSRITEALHRHFKLLNFRIENLDATFNPSVVFPENCLFIIASHTTQDSKWVEKALVSNPSYVGMIGSLKRANEVLRYLNLVNQKIDLPLFIPVGMDIDAQNPEEIALSVVTEYLTLREHNG